MTMSLSYGSREQSKHISDRRHQKPVETAFRGFFCCVIVFLLGFFMKGVIRILIVLVHCVGTYFIITLPR